MANTVRIGGARIDITGQDAEFQKMMRRAGKTFDRQRKTMKRYAAQARLTNKALGSLKSTIGTIAIGLTAGFGARGLVQAAKAAAEYSTQLVEGARNTNLMATELEAIAAIFEQDGIGFQATTTALATFQKRIAEGRDGMAQAKRSFSELGLSLDTLSSKSSREQFVLLAEALSRVEDHTTKQRIAQDLFGRSGKALVGTINQLSGTWNAAITKSDAMTKATNAQLKATKGLTGGFTDLKRQLQDIDIRYVSENTDEILRAAERLNYWKVQFRSALLDLDDTIINTAHGIKVFSEFIANIRSDIFSVIPAWQAMKQAFADGPNKEDTTIRIRIAYKDTSYIPIDSGLLAAAKAQAQARLEAQRALETMTVGKVDLGLQAALDQQALAEQAEKAAESVRRNWESAYASMAQTAGQAVGDMLAGFQTLGDGIRTILSGILSQWAQLAVINPISNTIGGFLGIPGIPGRAGGGPVRAGMPYIVGEQRPELFVPDRSGTILPDVPNMGNTIITNNFGPMTVGSVPGETAKETEQRFLGLIDRKIQYAFRNLKRGSYERLTFKGAS